VHLVEPLQCPRHSTNQQLAHCVSKSNDVLSVPFVFFCEMFILKLLSKLDIAEIRRTNAIYNLYHTRRGKLLDHQPSSHSS